MTANSTAMSIPVKSTPPNIANHSGGGRGPAPDILAAWDAIKDTRGETYLVAQDVHNPNRYFDAFKALGAEVIQRQTGARNDEGRKLFNVYATIPADGPKPHLKPSRLKGTEVVQANAA